MSGLGKMVRPGRTIEYGNVCQALFASGDLQALAEAGGTCVTANPSAAAWTGHSSGRPR